MKNNEKHSFYTEVFEIVKKIPKGRITSYGRIAILLGRPRAARAVGYALNSLTKTPNQEIPWQRVINSRGSISEGEPGRSLLQRKLLEKEGIEFNVEGVANFSKQGWP
jgi:methylated-DNA-protein-cysteine methyltransferase-like protein